MIIREIIDNTVRVTASEPVFAEKYDLIVVGLGTAGAVSLITAGREGLSVLGVEQFYGMGGTGTIGSICYYYFGAEGGLYTEIDDKSSQLMEGIFAQGNIRDTKGLVLEREAKACGAAIKYNCIVTGVYMEGNALRGLRLFQDGQEISVAAEMIIDATGEAAVCHLAGCESDFGRAFDQQAQPATSAGVVISNDGKLFALNKDAGFIRQHDPRDVSRVIINSNTFPMYLKDSYAKESRRFAAVAPLPGIREGRRIAGRKTLKMEDAVRGVHTDEKPLFYTFCNLDNHGKDIAFEDTELCDWMVAAGLWGVLISVPVPMEVLIPKDLENIMVAGRCLSVDHDLAAAVRAQRDMAKCGEAAAYVCSEAIKGRTALAEVKYENIVDKLKAGRCLNEENDLGFRERVAGEYLGNALPELNTPEEITQWLAGEKPGWAIWSAKLLFERATSQAERQRLVEKLAGNLNSADQNLSANSALALGLMGERCALEKLRELAKEPDNYVPKSSLKYVYTRGVSAIYLLGRLADAESEDILFDIIERRGRTALPGFCFGEFYNEDTDVYSQYVLFAARALADIAAANPGRKQQIARRLLMILEDPHYAVMITLRDNSASLHDLKPKLVEYIRFRTGEKSDGRQAGKVE